MFQCVPICLEHMLPKAQHLSGSLTYSFNINFFIRIMCLRSNLGILLGEACIPSHRAMIVVAYEVYRKATMTLSSTLRFLYVSFLT